MDIKELERKYRDLEVSIKGTEKPSDKAKFSIVATTADGKEIYLGTLYPSSKVNLELIKSLVNQGLVECMLQDPAEEAGLSLGDFVKKP
jgi:hypothetical protein